MMPSGELPSSFGRRRQSSTGEVAFFPAIIALQDNAAERALRGLALGRRAWLFAGSDRGAERAAVICTLNVMAKLNEIDPQTWLADVLSRIAHHRISELERLLPWHWAAERAHRNVAA
jgi:transposase